MLIKPKNPMQSSRANDNMVLETIEGILKFGIHLLIDSDKITQKEK